MSRHRRLDARTQMMDGRDCRLLAIALLVVAIHTAVYLTFTNGILR